MAIFDILRPDDLLALSVETQNLVLSHKDPKNPELVVQNASQPALLIFHFPPQSIVERAYLEAEGSGGDTLDPPGSVIARMSGSSRLVFQLPAKTTRIPFTIQSLLDWSKLKLLVSPAANVPKGGKPPAGLTITPPTDIQTALELPYRLILSPTSNVGWSHATVPVNHSGWTELWHTRLSRLVPRKGKPSKLVEPTDFKPVSLRAIWSPDFLDHLPLPSLFDIGPFRAAMAPRDRDQIVILTSGFNGYFLPGGAAPIPFVPTPIGASRLFLSTMGGWLSSRGNWDPLPSYQNIDGGTSSLDLTEWIHIATEARDHYVKIVTEGFLYPFGHRAALVKVTERKFIGADEGVVNSPVAYLRQRQFIIVREPAKTYTGAPYVHHGLEMPMAGQVRITTAVTPEIDDPATSAIPGSSGSFWVRVNGAPFPFHLSGLDLAGAQIDFKAALVFMAVSETAPLAVQAQYAGSGDVRACNVHGKKVTYADPNAGDTVLKTLKLFFDSQILQAGPPYLNAPFIPKLDDAGAALVSIPAITEILGISPQITIHLYSGYLTSGLDPNAGVFAEINNPPGISFSADKAGGFATPSLQVTGVSARKGLVGGSTDDASLGLIDPAAFFPDTTAQLFGVIPLKGLIPVDVHTNKANAAVNAPEIRSQALPNRKNPQKIITRVKWEPQLTSYSTDGVTIEFNPASVLSLHVQLERPLDGTPPSSQVDGKLSNFLITLADVIGLQVTSIDFNSQNGSKTNVAAHLPSKNPIKFLGPLAFVQTLADVLPPGIFGGTGPAIDLTSTGIRVAYTIGLPPLSIGVFALENIAITTGLDLPYLDGKPGFEFAFASRHKPFLITVECLGGGGFVHLVLNTDGVQMVEGALEFGGEFSIDLGVASGGVHVMAGIYFKLQNTSSTLTGFVDIGGEVSVLGIISISIDLNLSLSFISTAQGNKVQGRATLTISVHILFFSVSASVSVERSFGSGSGDPRVEQLITADDWAEYAAAFA